jgi:hypothetical protein
MMRKIKPFLRTQAHYYGLVIRYVTDLPPNVPGLLVPAERPHTIVVNANRSKSDHAFTILHEIGHFILHYERSHRVRFPSYLTREWKSKRMIRFSKLLRYVVARKMGLEAQADGWAFCALLGEGALNDALAICAQHPEKRWTFRVVFVSSIYHGIKRRVKKAIKGLIHPFAP